MKQVTIYTDGGCYPNPGGPGGWAAVVLVGGERFELFGRSDGPTTNNRMEITAAIEALNFLAEPSEVTLTTDSEYLRQGAREWMFSWERRRWRGAGKNKGALVENADLWQQIWRLCAIHRVTWKWVRGHGDCAENLRCDYLAGAARLQPHNKQAA